MAPDTMPTVLVVEDEEDTASLIRFILERAQYRVVHAENGKRAQELIGEMAPPTLVLLDVMLPFVGGLQLLPMIRAKNGWEQVPVVMLTADSSEHDVKQALETGASDYIVKPFNPRELLARLQRYIKKAA
ncbi:MAG: response regulator transcription factor [Nitrospiraceae bacterium]